MLVSTRSNVGPLTTDTYTYLNDSHGRHVEVAKNGVVEQRFIYDEHGRLIAELGTAGELKTHFVYATMSHAPDYLIKNGVMYKIVHDQLGSVRKIVESATGSVVSSLEYDEFGRVTASVARDFQPLGFAGGLREDVTRFVRFGARDYDPEVGRWTSKDPILFRGEDTNLYGYVIADPVNLIDADGTNPYVVRIIIGGGLACIAAPESCKNLFDNFGDWYQCQGNPDCLPTRRQPYPPPSQSPTPRQPRSAPPDRNPLLPPRQQNCEIEKMLNTETSVEFAAWSAAWELDFSGGIYGLET